MTPTGFEYFSEVISDESEQALLSQIRDLEFSKVEMRGMIAKRRVVHYGWVYGYESWRLTPGPPIPEFLSELRQNIGTLVGTTPESFEEVLITEYPAGASIGWHCDAPMFDIVVGVSLAAPCRLRLRPVRIHQPVWTQ